LAALSLRNCSDDCFSAKWIDMKLAAKLILVFLFGVLAVVVLFSWQTIQRQRQWDRQLRENHANDLVETLTPAITQAYREGGTVTIQKAVEVSTQKLSGAQVRWIDGKEVPEVQTRTITRQFSSVSVSNVDGTRTDYSYVPIVVDGDDAGTVEVAMPTESQEAHFRESLQASLLSLLGVAFLSAMVIYFGGVQLVGKPLGKLIEQVNTIGDGKLAQPSILSSHDELGLLAQAISQMSYKLSEQRDTIRHTDRLGTVGVLAAGVAHELGTPLNVVSGRAQLIASGKLTPNEIDASAKTIKSEADRMTAIIRQLLDFARQAPSPHSVIETNSIVLRTCELLRPLAKNANVEIVSHLPGQSLFIEGDAAQVQQVLTNLVSNGIQAMPSGGLIEITLSESSADHRVIIQVTDGGVGMDSRQLDRAFEPFYTTKDVGQGTGLGLSIAYGIVREHGGEISAESQPGVGTSFRVAFPAAHAVKS
jgi:two-component system NtrC family sensor kinase